MKKLVVMTDAQCARREGRSAARTDGRRGGVERNGQGAHDVRPTGEAGGSCMRGDRQPSSRSRFRDGRVGHWARTAVRRSGVAGNDFGGARVVKPCGFAALGARANRSDRAPGCTRRVSRRVSRRRKWRREGEGDQGCQKMLHY